MKVSVNRELLEKNVFAAHNVAESKGAIHILGYIFCEAEGNSLTLKATDLDLSITITLDADVIEPGKILLNSKTFYDTIKKGINAEVLIESNEQNHCHINTGTDYSLVGLDPSEFPELPEGQADVGSEIEKDAFLEAVRKTIYSASDSEARAALNGLYLEKSDSGITFVATDGHRLALSTLETSTPIADSEGVILARKGIQEVIKSIPSSEETIRVGFFDRFAIFEWTNVKATLRLVNADFPAYQQVIPDNLPNTVILDRQTLLDSIGRVATVSNDRFNSLKLAFEPGEPGSVQLSCNNFEQGESKDTLAVEYGGPAIEIGFNIRYIQQAASTFKSQEIQIRFNDNLGASILSDPSDENTLAVVMPLRI